VRDRLEGTNAIVSALSQDDGKRQAEPGRADGDRVRIGGFVWSIACITSDPVVSVNLVTESYDKDTTLGYEVMTAAEEVAQQVQQTTPDTGRPRTPRPQPLKGTARRAGRPRRNDAVSAERSLTG
jgi:hypothetical protein